MAVMFNDWNAAMRELRYVNAINMYGPSPTRIATRLRINAGTYRAWLVGATYRWPIYEDDQGGLHIGEQK
jgi:hypothetical protein